MTTEPLELAAVDRVLSRLDRQMSSARVSCIERLLFFGLTVSVYAIPLLTGASVVGRTLDVDTYRGLLGYLDALLLYAMVAAVAFVPLNVRLFARTLAHRQMIRCYEDLRLADYLFGRRGRPEESADARVMLVYGVPVLLTAVLIVSVVAGAWVGRAPQAWTTLFALAACIAFFFVQHRCRQLFEFLRRRIDFSREVLTVKRRLEQRRRRALELNTPVMLNRDMALRLSDLDRMYVLSHEAAARVRARRPGITGATVTWDPAALAQAAHLADADRVAIETAVQRLSIEIVRHRKALRREGTTLPSGFTSALAKADLTLQRDGVQLTLDLSLGRPGRAMLTLSADDLLERLVVTSVVAERGDLRNDSTTT